MAGHEIVARAKLSQKIFFRVKTNQILFSQGLIKSWFSLLNNKNIEFYVTKICNFLLKVSALFGKPSWFFGDIICEKTLTSESCKKDFLSCRIMQICGNFTQTNSCICSRIEIKLYNIWKICLLIFFSHNCHFIQNS